MRFLSRSAWLALLTLCVSAHADVTLPRLLSDGMVLQRNQPVVIWGWASEGERVTVQLATQTRRTRAKNRRWQVTFAPLQTGPGFQISIQGNNHLTLHDVLVGEVWIASGQSNMELPLRRVVPRYADIVQNTFLPAIREFSVPTMYSFQGPQDDFPVGQWKTATPDNLDEFSAVGFFYARSLYAKLHIPIGIISLSVGGSPAQAWMSEAALSAYPHYLDEYKKYASDSTVQKTIADDQASVAAWAATVAREDLGLQQGWNSAWVDVHDWPTLTIPGALTEQHIDFTNGVIWLRKTLTLNAAQSRQPALLHLGAMVDADDVFINGQPVGNTTYRYPPRLYSVPNGLLHSGENSIAIRLTSSSSQPGFVPDKTYALQLGTERLSLDGEWHYRVGMRCGPMPPTTTLHYLSGGLFNAKLAPVLHTAIRGVIWYQGESNTTRAEEYAALFPALIQDWRSNFKQGDFPFLYVQLANFMQTKNAPAESEWAQLRQAQRSALRVDHTGMAVAIDLGEWNDIHPLNKKDVGERLALLAKKMVYGETGLIASGPLAVSLQPGLKSGLEKPAHALLVKFAHSSSALQIRGTTLKEIAIAGADHQFHWASARIVNQSLLVWSEQVSDPRTVRYAWADNPSGANLYNAAGLPAAPFELSVNSSHN